MDLVVVSLAVETGISLQQEIYNLLEYGQRLSSIFVRHRT